MGKRIFTNKMTFIHTIHANQRLKTRGIPPPDKSQCLPVGKKIRRRIAQLCPDNGCNLKEYIYFRNREGGVYVTKQIDAGVYLLITAFKV